MALRTFLAMTAAEMQRKAVLPEAVGWMACHFSPYGNGLSNLPGSLPTDSLLILNDRIPIAGHSPQVICQQLETWISEGNCSGLLVDFQRASCPELAGLVRHLSEALICPMAVSEPYAHLSNSAVFLPPLPHHIPLAEYISPWQGREIWLELALDTEVITVTEKGCRFEPLSHIPLEDSHMEDTLRCHYSIETKPDCVSFSLWRTRQDLEKLLKQPDRKGDPQLLCLLQKRLQIFRCPANGKDDF